MIYSGALSHQDRREPPVKEILWKQKGIEMGDKGKKDIGKREQQKKGNLTLKEKRKQKKDKKNK